MIDSFPSRSRWHSSPTRQSAFPSDPKTRFETENNAARSVAGSSTYTVIRRSTTGSGTNWVCTMVIEYTRR